MSGEIVSGENSENSGQVKIVSGKNRCQVKIVVRI